MNERHKKYLVAGIDLSGLRNSVEEHVVECLITVLGEQGIVEMDQDSISDIYALALNQLPALYPRRDVTGPDDPVRAWNIHAVVENALHRVRANPKKR